MPIGGRWTPPEEWVIWEIPYTQSTQTGGKASITRQVSLGKAPGGQTMPTKSFALLSFEDQILLRDELIEPGTLPWLLREHASLLFPKWLFAGWKGEVKVGRKAWPGGLLMALLLLRHSEAGQTRVGAIRRAGADASWRSALRLPWSEKPPTEKTLREFEAFLKEDHPDTERARFELAFEHWTRLCLEAGLVGEAPVWVADSTPMWCFGAVHGTVRLLGDGLRSLARLWASARKVELRTVALEWDSLLLVAKSTKGFFEGTDWSDMKARSKVLTELVATVARATERVLAGLETVRPNKRKRLARRCKNLLRVVEEDLEGTEDGGLRVRRRRSAKRLISVTDPEAQHFRKSASKVCSGFKIHGLGDAVSGLVLALSVTPGGIHDSTQLVPLLELARSLRDDIEEVLADTAYGGMETRNAAKTLGVEVVAPPVRNSRKGDGVGREDFAIDFEAQVMTCPGGVSTTRCTRFDNGALRSFTWTKASEAACSCRDKCLVHKARPRKDGSLGPPRRRMVLHPDEEGLRAARAEWNKPERRTRYRRRGEGERLMRELTRRGARHAAGWGLESAALQAHAAASVGNLLILAKHLAGRSRRKAA